MTQMTAIDFTTRNIPPTSVLNGRGCVAHVNDVSILVSNVSKWTNAEVQQILDETAKAGGGVSPPANIAIFLGDVFDAGQRKLATEWTLAQGFTPAKRITLISDSMLIRGALTAYSWLTKTEAKAFAMKDSDNMCKWITEGLIARPEAVKTYLSECFSKVGANLP